MESSLDALLLGPAVMGPIRGLPPPSEGTGPTVSSILDPSKTTGSFRKEIIITVAIIKCLLSTSVCLVSLYPHTDTPAVVILGRVLPLNNLFPLFFSGRTRFRKSEGTSSSHTLRF